MKVCSLFVFLVLGVTTSAFVLQHPTFAHPKNQKDSFALFVAEPKQINSVTNRNPLTPAQRLLIKNRSPVKDDTVGAPSNFDTLKNVAYAVGDRLTSLGGNSYKTSKDQIYDGYADMRGSGRNAISSSPTQRLLEVLQKRPPPNEVVEVKIKKPTQQTRTIFDSVKGALYGTADLASAVAQTAATTTVAMTPDTPVLKPVNPQTQIVLRRETFGNNPFERLSADIQENVKQQTKQVTDGIDKLKSDVTVASDFLSTTAADIQAVPGRLQSFFVATVDKTIQAVDNIKALPTKMQQKVETTKQSVQDAVEVVEEVSTSAKVLLGLEKPKPRPPKLVPPSSAGPEELAWQVAGSVLNGAGRAVWWMGSGAAGLTWNAVKDQIQKERVNAASVMDDQLTPSTSPFLSSKVMEMAASRVTSNDAATLVDQLVAKSMLESISNEDEQFNREIAEALQLANEALAMVSESSKPEPTPSLDVDVLNQEIEAALLLAQEALAAAEM